jgi:hypothetical protein
LINENEIVLIPSFCFRKRNDGLPFIRVTVREDGNQEKDQCLALAKEIFLARGAILGGLERGVKGISPGKTLKSLCFVIAITTMAANPLRQGFVGWVSTNCP